MPFKYTINGGQKSNRRAFRLGDPVYDNGQLLGGECRYTPHTYISQFEFELMHENSLGRVVEVCDTKSDQIYYIAHRWTRPDKRAFRIVGKATSLKDAQTLLRQRDTAIANANEMAA